jgi:hypothetical protein
VVTLDRDMALVILLARACLGTACSDACHEGRCVPARCSSVAPGLCGPPCASGEACGDAAVDAVSVDGPQTDAGPDAAEGGAPCDCAGDAACVLDPCGPCAAPGTTCDDGSACTSEDRCVDGVCRGTPRVCVASNECERGVCDEATGRCTVEVLTDGTSCSRGRRCCSGTCVSTSTDADNCGGCGIQCRGIGPLNGICIADGDTGRCGCIENSQCRDPGRCGGTGTCLCESDDACAEGQICATRFAGAACVYP